MTYRTGLLLVTFQLSLIGCFGQEGSYTKIEKQIEAKVARENMEQTKGWKVEHRWMDEFKKRVDPNGNFYDGAVFYDEAIRVSDQKLNSNAKLNGWIPVGPDSRADQSFTTALGRINCIAFHPTDPSTYWVGVAQGGVWKTSDDGQNWTPLTDDLPVLRISDIAVVPNNPDIIYICVGDYAYLDSGLDLDDRKRHSHYGMGVYKTTDGGTTWTPTGLTYQLTDLDGSLMRRVFVDPTNSSSLVAAGIGGIWTSSDSGSNWTMSNDSLIRDLKMDPNNTDVLYASTGYLKNSDNGTAGIMKSTDFGATWNWLNTGIPEQGAVLRIEIAIAPTNSNHLYAIAADSVSGFYGLYSSIDAGVNWTYSDAGGKNILEWYEGGGSGGQGWYDLSILVDPIDENTVYTGGVNVWGSSDGGVTFDGVSMWWDLAGPGIHADQHQFKYNPLNNKFYVCNDGGLIRTSDIVIGSWDDAYNLAGYSWPTVWEYMSDGMQTSSFYRIGLSEGNPGNFSAGAQDNSTYFNNNGNWSNLFGGDGMNTMLHPTDPDIIYGSSQYGRILYSNNGGSNYGQMNGPNNEDGEWVTPFMFKPGTTNTVYAGFGNLYSATPGNDFNVPMSNFGNMPGASVPSPSSHFNVSQSEPDNIYYAKRNYFSYNQLSELWVTNDGGVSWSNKTQGLPDSLYFTYVEVDDNDPLSAWVVTGGYEAGKHVYHTIDGGDIWMNVTYDLPNLPTNSIVHVDSSFYNTVYVGTDIGVYYSNDTLAAWLPYNTNLPNVIVGEIDINYSEGKMYAATFGRGVWMTDLLADSIIGTAGLQDLELDEIQIDLYPNPNNGEYALVIDGFSGSELDLEIIDIMGAVVKKEKIVVANGKHSSTMNHKLSNGMYFLKVSHGKRMRTVRFVVQ